MEDVDEMGWYDVAPIALAPLARLAIAIDDPESALTSAGALLTVLESGRTWVTVTWALPAIAQLLTTVDQGARARRLLARCRTEWQGLDAPMAPAAMLFAEGCLDVTDGEWAMGAEECIKAAELYDELDCPYEAAQAREQAALALLKATEVRAQETLQTALAIYRRLGATWDVARCTQAARSHGVRLAVPHQSGRKGYGNALSPREEQVARLAGEGLTNREIGARLFLSPLTVSKHLSRVMRKIGVHSRAAVAARLPPEPGQDR